MTIYAIRKVGTSHYLPARDGRGHSFEEPVDIATRSPRVFFSYRSARAALGAWLSGKWKAKHYDGEFEGIKIEAVEDRKIQDMEIIAFNLSELMNSSTHVGQTTIVPAWIYNFDGSITTGGTSQVIYYTTTGGTSGV